MSSAKKFVLTIAADYEGQSELKKLQTDLKTIGQIDSFEKLRLSWQKTNAEFVTAKAKVRELSKALKDGGGKDIERQYAAASKEVKKLGTSLAKQKGQMDASRIAIKQTGIAMDGMAGSYKKLKSASGDQGKVLAAQMKLGIRATKDVNSEINGLKRAYKELKQSGTQSIKELAVAKDRLRTKVAELRHETSGWTSHLEKIQTGWAGLLVTAGAVAGAFKGIQFFAGFDDSMREVQAVSGATGVEMEKLTGFAKDLGSTTRFTATEIAQGMAELAQSGMKTQEIFTTLPDVINLTSASGMQFKESADLLTDTMKQFVLDGSESGRVADVIVKGYTSAGHSAQQLGEALSYVGPVAKQMGYSLEDTVAILDALAESGYKGQRAGTALKGGFARLIKPVGEAEDILEKYSIQVEDSEGKTRNFADIIDDLGAAGMSSKEKMTLFGLEAGPGMMALLSQGGNSIRDFQKLMEDAGGTAAQIAGGKEAGIGGALRSLMSSLQAIVIAFGDSLAPAIQGTAELMTVLARVIASLPQPILWVASAVGGLATAFATWHLGLKHIFNAIRLGSADVATLGGKFTDLAEKSKLASAGLKMVGKAFALLAAWDIGWTIGTWLNQFDLVKKAGISLSAGLTKGFLKIKKAWTWVTGGDTAAVQREIDEAEQIYAEMFAEVGKKAEEAGGKIKNVHRDAAVSAKESAGVQQEAVDDALEAMKKKYQEYVDKVKQLQDEIAGRERSLAEQLRAMSRTGMSDLGAWKDRKREAEEYEAAARRAMEAGNYEEAVKLADKAKDAYADLNKEVKDGEKVAVSQQQALKTSMAGVKDAGKLAVVALEAQQDAAAAAMETLTEKSGFQDLTKGMDESKKTWIDNWMTMRKKAILDIEAVEDRLLKIKDKEITVWINEKVAKAMGGVVGSPQALRLGGAVMMAGGGFLNFLGGGHLPGFGGGDRRHIVGEDGEVMIKKESVRAAGLRAALAFNAGNWPLVMKELASKFAFKMQLGGAVGRFSLPPIPALAMQSGGAVSAPSMGHYTHDLNFQGATAPVRVMTDRQNTAAFISGLKRMQELAS
ncbi:MAG: phage tail tape measure protein [Proteobacteria bacterium]|nr:phage tail tape measure protein [Pseudomonadota bacterium]